ncbi:hypothetical protein LCGC14_1899350 [marine sediment metagenome]|uniref:Uncharacterized protein n=1 Tax=marine sediment metagenome TaxID=412755 RepID=A0A0F9FX23_9ZZZZ
MKSNKENEEQRAKEFLECLGNGKPIHQCENESDEEEFDYTHR